MKEICSVSCFQIQALLRCYTQSCFLDSIYLNYSFQIVLNKDQAPEDGRKIAESVMDLLQIGRADLIDCAYLDLLNRTTTV